MLRSPRSGTSLGGSVLGEQHREHVADRDDADHGAADGDDLDKCQALDIMTADLVTAAPDDTIASVGVLMRDAGVRHVPVAVGGTVVGVVSIRDVLAVLLPQD